MGGPIVSNFNQSMRHEYNRSSVQQAENPRLSGIHSESSHQVANRTFGNFQNRASFNANQPHPNALNKQRSVDCQPGSHAQNSQNSNGGRLNRQPSQKQQQVRGINNQSMSGSFYLQQDGRVSFQVQNQE